MSDALAGRACPICGRPARPGNAPFCSSRCADVDLHNWLTGRYAIPAMSDEDEPEPEIGDQVAGQPNPRSL